jgi:hypothetical protein
MHSPFQALNLLIKGYSIHLFDAEPRKDDADHAALRKSRRHQSFTWDGLEE